jgi:hypothetical protein
MNKKKILVNPYLFLLARRMLDYEVVGMGKPPSDLQIAHFIYDRYKGERYTNTTFSDKPKIRNSSAFSKAERIRKFVLPVRDFMISEEMLGHLVVELTALVKFNSWTEFTHYFSHSYEIIGRCHVDIINKRKKGMSAKAIYDDMLLNGNPLIKHFDYKNTEFTENDYSTYLAYANQSLFVLTREILAEDWQNEPVLYYRFWDVDKIARSANSDELHFIEEVRTKKFNYAIPFLKELKKWHQKYKNVFLQLLTIENLYLGAGILVPVSEALYRKIQHGALERNQITEDDLVLSEQQGMVKYIFLEILFSDEGHKDQKEISREYSALFKEIIQQYYKMFSPKKLIIGAMASSKFEIDFLKGIGFSQNAAIRLADDHKTIQVFYELECSKSMIPYEKPKWWETNK